MRLRWFLFSLIFIAVFVFIAFLYFATSTFPYPKPPKPGAVDLLLTSGEVIFDPDYIAFVLNEFGAYKLHTPPLSTDLPKIEVVLGERVYGAEVSGGNVFIEERRLKEADIRILSSEQEIISAIQSKDAKNYFRKSIAEGKTKVEQVGSSSQLFSKGYLPLYNELTGKSMTGNIVDIFQEN